jgi:hypothetical protein
MSEAHGVTTLTAQPTPLPYSLPAEVPPVANDVRRPGQERSGAPGTPEWYLYGLAGVARLGFFALTVTMTLTKIPESSQSVAYMLLGGLVTGFSMVLSYFFGSSAGSAHKTAQLAELMKQGTRNRKGLQDTYGGR